MHLEMKDRLSTSGGIVSSGRQNSSEVAYLIRRRINQSSSLKTGNPYELRGGRAKRMRACAIFFYEAEKGRNTKLSTFEQLEGRLS